MQLIIYISKDKNEFRYILYIYIFFFLSIHIFYIVIFFVLSTLKNKKINTFNWIFQN